MQGWDKLSKKYPGLALCLAVLSAPNTAPQGKGLQDSEAPAH